MSEGTPITPEIFKDEKEKLAVATINKLSAIGITTLEKLAAKTPQEIVDLTGITIGTAAKAVNVALNMIGINFISGEELHSKRKNSKRCSTGSKQFDRILGGGIETEIITELIGGYGSGKSQTCYTASVIASQPEEKGGLNGKVIYLDTEGTLEKGGIDRIVQIAESRGIDSRQVLKNLLTVRAHSSRHQELLINALDKICTDNHVKLIIVDSMIAHFRSEYVGRGTLADRQGTIGALMGRLLRIAETYKIAVIVTNQLQSSPTVAYGDPDKAAGGHVFGHAATVRVRLWKYSEKNRQAAVIDAAYLPEERIRFSITKAGITDEDGSFGKITEESEKVEGN